MIAIMKDLGKLLVFQWDENFKLKKLYPLKYLFIVNSNINNYHYLISATEHLKLALL